MKNIVHVIIKFKNTLFYSSRNDYYFNKVVGYLLITLFFDKMDIYLYRTDFIEKSLKSIRLAITERQNKSLKILLESICYCINGIHLLEKKHPVNVFQIYKFNQTNSLPYYIDKKLVKTFYSQKNTAMQKILNTS